MPRKAVLAAALLGLTTSPSAAKKMPTVIPPLDKISQSFSSEEFGSTEMPKGAQLTKDDLNHPDCSPKKLADCYVMTTAGVELYFSPYDGLNGKRIDIAVGDSASKAALGIGTARSRKDVMAALNRFVRGLNFTCENFEEAGGTKSPDVTCFAPVPEKAGKKAIPIEEGAPSVELIFDNKDRLKSAGVRQTSYID